MDEVVLSRDVADALEQYAKLREGRGKEVGYCSTIDEVFLYYTIAKEVKPDVIFESGTALGWSSFWWAFGSPETPVYTWDIAMRDQYWNRPNITKLQGSFDKEIAELIERYKNDKKLFFLDSDHHWRVILNEFYAIAPFVKVGDVLVFHDSIGERGVIKALGKINKLRPEWKRIDYLTSNGVTAYTVTTNKYTQLERIERAMAQLKLINTGGDYCKLEEIINELKTAD